MPTEQNARLRRAPLCLAVDFIQISVEYKSTIYFYAGAIYGTFCRFHSPADSDGLPLSRLQFVGAVVLGIDQFSYLG